MADNPLHKLLEDAGVPWRLPRSALAERYGVRQHSAYQWEVIEITTPLPFVQGMMWPLSAATLIFWHRQLYLVPMADVIGFHVDRFVRGKGPGGAKLYVECRTNYEDLTTKRLLITEAPRADDLNELARSISAAIAKPFALSQYWPDD